MNGVGGEVLYQAVNEQLPLLCLPLGEVFGADRAQPSSQVALLGDVRSVVTASHVFASAGSQTVLIGPSQALSSSGDRLSRKRLAKAG